MRNNNSAVVNHRCSDSIFFLLLCFSKILGLTHLLSTHRMSAVSDMKHHHLRRIVLRTAWPVSVRSIPMLFGSVVVHPDEDDSISELFRLNPVLSHRHLDFTKQLQCCVSLENLSTRTRLILRRYNPIHDIQ